MAFNAKTMHSICEICGKHRALKVHERCSKIRQKRGIAEKKKAENELRLR